MSKIQPFYLCNVAHDLNFSNMKPQEMKCDNHFILIHKKNYSELHYFIDNTTYFSHQSININAISHTSNYQASWQMECKLNYYVHSDHFTQDLLHNRHKSGFIRYDEFQTSYD